jgi:MFS family permease
VTALRALRTLPTEVWLLGAVSLLSDAASDLVYPLLPKLFGTFGAGALALGVMEGVAELLSAFVKVWAGRAHDRGAPRGPLVVGGYGLAALARPLMALAASPLQIVAIRTLDRAGKGLRSAPRDAILAAAAPPDRRGLAFGLHRGMDNLGAVIGPLLALLLLGPLGFGLRGAIAIAAIPGALSVLLAWLVVRRVSPSPSHVPVPVPVPVPDAPRAPLGPGPRALLIATGCFALGASADSFLMARLGDLGLGLTWIPIAWITLQLGKSLLNVPGGAIADRLGPRRVLLASWIVYALAYVAFARATSWGWFWAALPLYAIHYGLGEGAEKSLMTRLAPASARGTAYGAQHAVHGLALLPANVVFGWIYQRAPGTAFTISATLAALGAALLLVGVREPETVDALP